MSVASLATSRPSALGPRLRPGERPAWWDARADADAFESWRANAHSAQLSVDAWAALLLELELVLADLKQSGGRAADLAEAVIAPEGVAHLGPASALRGWLSHCGRPRIEDELPELVLPERLIARLTPGRALTGLLAPDRIKLALACDRRAALVGRTLESWALSYALSRR